MKTNQMGGGPNASDPSLAAKSLKNKQTAAAKKGSVIKKTNSWEEEDVKRGRKYAAEGKRAGVPKEVGVFGVHVRKDGFFHRLSW